MIDAFADASDIHHEIGAAGRIALAEALGDRPDTVIATHLLRRGLARAYVSGPPSRFAAAVIQKRVFSTDELTAYGADAAAIWELVRRVDGWPCVLVDAVVADTTIPSLISANRSCRRHVCRYRGPKQTFVS